MVDRTTLVDPLTDRRWDIPNDRLNPWHTVTIYETHWHMAHPITCDLTSCEFEAEAKNWDGPFDALGVYRWDDDGWDRIGSNDDL
jgi:hypothetical protein